MAMMFGLLAWGEEPEPSKPVPPLSDEDCDKVLRAVFGSRVQRCVGCGGAGRVTELMRCVDGRRVPMFAAECPVCNGKTLISVVAA